MRGRAARVTSGPHAETRSRHLALALPVPSPISLRTLRVSPTAVRLARPASEWSIAACGRSPCLFPYWAAAILLVFVTNREDAAGLER